MERVKYWDGRLKLDTLPNWSRNVPSESNVGENDAVSSAGGAPWRHQINYIINSSGKLPEFNLCLRENNNANCKLKRKREREKKSWGKWEGQKYSNRKMPNQLVISSPSPSPSCNAMFRLPTLRSIVTFDLFRVFRFVVPLCGHYATLCLWPWLNDTCCKLGLSCEWANQSEWVENLKHEVNRRGNETEV